MTELFAPDRLYLAMDTSGGVGSVAVGQGREVLARSVIPRRGDQAARLIPVLHETLEEAGVALDEVSGIVVGEGPGSFTGVRVAAATAKGLARGLGCPMWAVSSLAGLAMAVPGAGVRYVLFDARSDRIYGACYSVAEEVVALVPPHGGVLADVLAGDLPAGCAFLGDGALAHAAEIERAGHSVLEVDPEEGDGRIADGLLAWLGASPDRAAVADLTAWEPRYVRDWAPSG